MQSSPNVEFWLRVAAIGVPAISAIAVAVVTYVFGRSLAKRQKDLNTELTLYQSGLQQSLNKDLESHKKEINRDLENHRFQLQSDFQVRLHQFQTRFSWLHQRRAEVIEELYGMLARIEIDLECWVSSPYSVRNQMEEELYRIGGERLLKMSDFFAEKRIYFDQEISEAVSGIAESARVIYQHYPTVETTSWPRPQLDIDIKHQAEKLKAEKIGPLMALLEARFRDLLEAEAPSHHLDLTSSPDGSPDRKQQSKPVRGR